MQLYYNPEITAGGICTLDAEESRHAVRVMRLRTGDEMHVADGRGGLYACRIVAADDRACAVEAERRLEGERRPVLHLAVAPTKNPSRMEWLVEKAVEIGVGAITLLDCDHSERIFMKTERLEKLAVSAMKQSLRCWLPDIRPAVRLREWLEGEGCGGAATCAEPWGDGQRFIAHCESGQARTPLGSALRAGLETTVLIGPEGDFSTDEIALALDCGFVPVSLGDSRLRTETAAIYAVTAFNMINDI